MVIFLLMWVSTLVRLLYLRLLFFCSSFSYLGFSYINFSGFYLLFILFDAFHSSTFHFLVFTYFLLWKILYIYSTFQWRFTCTLAEKSSDLIINSEINFYGLLISCYVIETNRYQYLPNDSTTMLVGQRFIDSKAVLVDRTQFHTNKEWRWMTSVQTS